MAQDEPDVGVPGDDLVADEQVRRPCRVEQEVSREGWDARDGGPGQRGGMDEDDGVPPVQLGEQFRLAGLPQIDVRAVRQHDDPVGPEVVERPAGLGGGVDDRGQRNRGEEAEAIRTVLGQLRALVVHGPRHVRGLGRVRRRGDARGRDGQDRPRRLDPVHRRDRRGRAPLRQRQPAGVEDAVRGRPPAVGLRNHVLVDVDPPEGNDAGAGPGTAAAQRRRRDGQCGQLQHLPPRQLMSGRLRRVIGLRLLRVTGAPVSRAHCRCRPWSRRPWCGRRPVPAVMQPCGQAPLGTGASAVDASGGASLGPAAHATAPSRSS